MPRWMILCPRCNRYSTRLYRCEHDGCGHNLVDAPTPIEPFRYRSVFGERDDGLVEVEFRRICTECGSERFVATDYEDVPAVIRYPCDECGRPTKFRPNDEDLRYYIMQLGFDDGDQDEKHDDQTPSVSSPA